MDSLFDTVIGLVNAGFAGVGIVVILLLSLLMLRKEQLTPEKERLSNRILTWGISFAVLCGVLSVISPVVQAQWGVKPDSRPKMLRLAFSPSFETRKLPPPRIELPNGEHADPEKPFAITGDMIQISVDAALAEVENLEKTARALGESVKDYRKQRDELVAMTDAPDPSAESDLKVLSQQSVVLEAKVAQSISSGNFQAAAEASKQLRDPARGSKVMVERAIGREF